MLEDFETLFAVGCSMTKHQPLPYEAAWPHFLAQELNILNVVNMGAGGGSNRRSFRVSEEFLRTTSEDKSKILAVIQLTHPYRFEAKVKDGRWVNYGIWNTSPDKAPTFDERRLTEYSNLKLETYTIEEELYDIMMQANAISNLFNTHGIRHYFMTYGLNDKVIIKKDMFRNIPWVGGEIARSDIVRIGELYKKEYFYKPKVDEHPNAEGNKNLAKNIVLRLRGN